MPATNTPKPVLKAAFVERAKARHGERYDYSRVDYVNNSTNVCIVCPEHGEFWQRPNNHANGSKCPKCAGSEQVTKDVFIERSRRAHGDRYDYSKVVMRGVSSKVCIICPEHGEFWQMASDHTNGRGCKACGVIKCSGSNRRTLDEFIRQAKALHGDKFDYSRSVYINSSTPIEIECPEHGPFWQVPQAHITRHGCQACAGTLPISEAEFIVRSMREHGGRYDYSRLGYVSLRQPVTIVCDTHGPFLQAPKDHMTGSGCHLCAREATASRQEIELCQWVKSLGVDVVSNDRSVLSGFEVDIFVPSQMLGIEYNGAYWHSDSTLPHKRIHEVKQNAAKSAGVRLITVWDYQWQRSRELIQRHIQHALGMSDAKRIDARKCTPVQLSYAQASAFYDSHHIQGHAWRSMVNLGLAFDGELVAAMSFTQAGSRRGKTGSDEWELQRFATRGIVRGGASRLMARFIAEHDPDVVWSFSDRQHFAGGVYRALGFEVDGHTPADYTLHHQGTGMRWHKSAWQRRHIPQRLRELGIQEKYDPETDERTERDMQALAKVIRVMDSGKIRWKWTKKEAAHGGLDPVP